MIGQWIKRVLWSLGVASGNIQASHDGRRVTNRAIWGCIGTCSEHGMGLSLHVYVNAILTVCTASYSTTRCFSVSSRWNTPQWIRSPAQRKTQKASKYTSQQPNQWLSRLFVPIRLHPAAETLGLAMNSGHGIGPKAKANLDTSILSLQTSARADWLANCKSPPCMLQCRGCVSDKMNAPVSGVSNNLPPSPTKIPRSQWLYRP